MFGYVIACLKAHTMGLFRHDQGRGDAAGDAGCYLVLTPVSIRRARNHSNAKISLNRPYLYSLSPQEP